VSSLFRGLPLRRIFLLGAAALVCVAALVAVATILSGDFGETEGKIFATLATTFAAGSTVLAGLACLGRGVSRPLGVIGVLLACAGFVLWSAQIWGEFDSDGYWKLLGVLTAWTLALLVTTTTRLMLSSPSLVRRLHPATAAAAAGAAATATVMLLREQGDGWQLFAILLILALLGEALAPILERYSAADDRASERVLGMVAGAEVVAVPGRDSRSVRIGAAVERLAEGEELVVRERR
jgi:hypothetical protein